MKENMPRMPFWPAFALLAQTTMVFFGGNSLTAAHDDPRRTLRDY